MSRRQDDFRDCHCLWMTQEACDVRQSVIILSVSVNPVILPSIDWLSQQETNYGQDQDDVSKEETQYLSPE